jgi:hypothetical protein
MARFRSTVFLPAALLFKSGSPVGIGFLSRNYSGRPHPQLADEDEM